MCTVAPAGAAARHQRGRRAGERAELDDQLRLEVLHDEVDQDPFAEGQLERVIHLRPGVCGQRLDAREHLGDVALGEQARCALNRQ